MFFEFYFVYYSRRLRAIGYLQRRFYNLDTRVFSRSTNNTNTKDIKSNSKDIKSNSKDNIYFNKNIIKKRYLEGTDYLDGIY